MKSKKKRLRVILVLLTVTILGIASGFIFYFVSQSKIEVDVVPVANISTYWWGSSSVTNGQVTTDVSQAVNVIRSVEIVEVFVEEGQTVSAGDQLLAYDVSLLELQAEILEIDIQLAKNKITKAEQELRNFTARYPQVLSVKISAAEVTDIVVPAFFSNGENGGEGYMEPVESQMPIGPPEPIGPGVPIGPEDPTGTSEPEDPEGEVPIFPRDELTEKSLPYAGAGTREDPYRFFIRSGGRIGSDFITAHAITDKTEPLYILVEMRENNDFGGRVCCSIIMIFYPDGTFDYELKLDESLAPYLPLPSPGKADPTPEPTPTPEPSPTPSPTPAPPVGPVYTDAQLKQMYVDMQANLKSMKVNLRQLELDFKRMSAQVESGTVKSLIDGVVTGLMDPQAAQYSGAPIMTISGGSGYYIKGTISEFELDTVDLGQAVEIKSWYTGAQCPGTIVNIENYPTSGGYYGGNTNTSYYPFSVYVSGDHSLAEGEYVEMTLKFDGSGPAAGAEGNIIYMERAYVREDGDGRNYVMKVNAEGRLEKQYVATGQLLWGYYIEIVSGVPIEDRVAFPYGKDIKEGVRAKAEDGALVPVGIYY